MRCIRIVKFSNSYADISLLDDPISALDAHVGRYVFDNAIQKFLKDKTVLLVTHQLHLLPELDHIIVMGASNYFNNRPREDS